MKDFTSLVAKITFASLAALLCGVFATTSASALTIGDAATSTTCLSGKTGGCVVNIPVGGVDVPWLISNYTDDGYVQLMAMTNLCSISAVGCKDYEGAVRTRGTVWNASSESLNCTTGNAAGYCNKLASLKTYNYLTQMDTIYNLLPAQFGTTAKTSAVRNTTWDMDGFTGDSSGASPAVRSNAYNANVTKPVNLISFYEWNESKDNGSSVLTTNYLTEPLNNSLGDLFCMSRFSAEECTELELDFVYNLPWTRSALSRATQTSWFFFSYSPTSMMGSETHYVRGLLPTMWVASDIDLYGSTGTYINPYSMMAINAIPSINLFAPDNNSYYSTNVTYNSVSITGTVSDSDNDDQAVFYKIDDGSWNTLTTVTGMTGGSQVYSGSVDVSDLSEGDHTIYLKSNDGTVDSSEASVVIKMDKTAPTVTVYLGSANPTITRTMPKVTQDNADSDSGLMRMEIQVRSAPLTSGNCGTYGSWVKAMGGTVGSDLKVVTNFEYQTVMTTGNCYQYQVIMTDIAGNSTITVAANTIIYDTTVPTCSTWDPSSGAWHESGGTTFRLTCSDGTTGASGLSDTPVAGAYVSSGIYSCTTGTGNGATCTIQVKDLAGNTSVVYTSPPNNVDSATPDLEISGGSGNWFNVDKKATITASADSGIEVIRYEFVTGTNPVTTLPADCLSGGTTITSGAQTTNAPAGGATLFTCARSVSGVVATGSDTFKVDKTVPTCGTWNTPIISNTVPVTMTMTGSLDVGGSGLNTTTSETECRVATNGGTCSVTLYDNVGNKKVCTSKAALINSRPAAPVITSPNAMDRYIDSFVLEITGSDPDGDELVGWYKINSGSYIQISDNAFVSGGGTSKLLNIGALPDGKHTVTVKTVDTNNFASDEVSQVFTKYAAQVLIPSNNLVNNVAPLASNIIVINEGAQATLSGALGADGAAIDYEVCLTVDGTEINKCVTMTNDPTNDTPYDFILSSADFPSGRDVFTGGALSTRNTITNQTMTTAVNTVFYIKRNVPAIVKTTKQINHVLMRNGMLNK